MLIEEIENIEIYNITIHDNTADWGAGIWFLEVYNMII